MASKIKIVKETKVNFRADSARALYFEVLQKYNNKTVAAYVKEVEANPPKLPKSGKVEKGSGWISYFVGSGHMTISDS